MPLDDAVLTPAMDLFNRREFFECHEVLEDLWRPLPAGPDKQLLQGVLQVAVGLHHLRRLNYVGARNLLCAGIEKLEALCALPAYQSPIVLAALLAESQRVLETVLALGPDGLADFPPHLIPMIRFQA